ncbi:hypothetical protein RSOL_166050 [Rhizoctonia solani AG-3 Rhs1AP]|uniref:Uncharacterized protein n=1 Tax=Rhizoctonia solani AG-3 Rhs1AP TaxID=1086054 RepID=X8J2I4_9AGAM|nr:hypothetical protein RSOL_166050 [Rhizoctonia solani AG-3 Rhs1AP]
MFAIQHRQIPAQPGHIVNRRRANIGFCSLTYTSPYNELGYAQQSNDVPESRRSTTVSRHLHISLSLTGHSERTRSSTRTELARSSSRASSSSGNSSSGSSVQWALNDSNENVHTPTRRDQAASPKGSPKPILKSRDTNTEKSPSLSAEQYSIVATGLAIDDILKLLVSRVKTFPCPSELEFSLDCGSPMMLPNVEKNKSFIGQLRKLQKLAHKLDEISTHGEVQLKDKHNKVSMCIGRALFRMEEVQIKFYVNFLDSVYDDLVIEINVCIKSFVYPRELDFAENSEDGLNLADTEKNKPFIDQLRTLSSFRVQLGNIPEYYNEQLRIKRETIGEVIKRNLHRMKQHQLKLFYRRLTEAHRPHRL